MSKSYRLKDDGYKWKVIYRGRRRVGQVYRHVKTGVYHGKIGPVEATGASELEAFEEVAARELGYPNAAQLRAHNRNVRAANRQTTIFNPLLDLKGKFL